MRAVTLLKNLSGGTLPKVKTILLSFIAITLLFFQFTPSVMAWENPVPSDYVQKQYEMLLKENQSQNAQRATNTSTPLPTPTPTPSYVAKNDTDSQQLQLLHQIQNHALSNGQGLLLYLIMFSPLPISWKLGIYNFFSRLPLPNLSPTALTILITAGPILFLISLYFASKLAIYIFKALVPLILKRLRKGDSEKKFLELTFPSDTSKSAYATEQLYTLLHTLARRSNGFLGNMLGTGKEYSLEIVASRKEGIRFILAASVKSADIIRRSLLSFLPGIKIKEIEDYLTNVPAVNSENTKASERVGVVELTLSSDFVLPLQDLKTLSEHDSISYLTGAMTKLDASELISCQIVTTPVLNGSHSKAISHMQRLQYNMRHGLPIEPLLTGRSALHVPSFILFVLSPAVWSFVQAFKFVLSMPSLIIDNGKSAIILQSDPKGDQQALLNPYEQELQRVVKEKIGQHLFETSIRMLIVAKDKEELEARAEGLYASFGPFTSAYQGLGAKTTFPHSIVSKKRLLLFRQRAISRGLFAGENPILSTSEISDIFHFPYTDTTKTEGLVKSKSSELPAPLSFKKRAPGLDVIVGKNTYGGEETPIGQTLTQRRKHTYIIGKTGMGKTEMLKSIIYQDMLNGKGLCVLDPHGDLVQDLLKVVPKNRKADVIYFDPSDREWPIGINILSPGINFSSKEEAEERITSSIIAIFQKITPEQYWGPRMEHILRNATLTALQIKNPTLWTLQQLLTDKNYQRKAAATLSDPILKQFWEKEFANVGKMQLFSVTEPLTERLGLFITTKMSRHILLQDTSTVSIQKIMDEGKIFLVNLSKGNLGEDQSFFFGSLITSLIWMAAYQRTKIPESARRDFFLFVDEFQNFATKRFAEISSESRKFHVSLTASHQNIAQIEDPNIIKVVAGNADSFIAMKAGPDDEKFILPFMEPEVEKGDIVNLPPYKFFMKVTNEDSEDAFSGQTQLLDIKGSDAVAKEVIEYSRQHYATPRKVVEKYLEKLFAQMVTKKKTKKPPIKPPKKSW